jgi:hypothetical protein
MDDEEVQVFLRLIENCIKLIYQRYLDMEFFIFKKKLESIIEF